MPLFLTILFVSFIVFFLSTNVLKRSAIEGMLAVFLIFLIFAPFEQVIDSFFAPISSPVFHAIVLYLLAGAIFERLYVFEQAYLFGSNYFHKSPKWQTFFPLVAQTFMASISGAAENNVRITEPKIRKWQTMHHVSPAFTKNSTIAVSVLAHILPPAGIISLTYAVYNYLYPHEFTVSEWWIIAYGLGVLFFIHRWLSLRLMYRLHRIDLSSPQPMPLEKKWRGTWLVLFVPILIFLPIAFDAFAAPWIAKRITPEAQAQLSFRILMFAPVFAIFYVLLINKRFVPKKRRMRQLVHLLEDSMLAIIPASIMTYFACVSLELFIRLDAKEELIQWATTFDDQLGILFVLLSIVIVAMIFPGPIAVTLFGGTWIVLADTFGWNAWTLATLLPAFTGSIEGMMGLWSIQTNAYEELFQSSKMTLFWFGTHLLLLVSLFVIFH